MDEGNRQQQIINTKPIIHKTYLIVTLAKSQIDLCTKHTYIYKLMHTEIQMMILKAY